MQQNHFFLWIFMISLGLINFFDLRQGIAQPVSIRDGQKIMIANSLFHAQNISKSDSLIKNNAVWHFKVAPRDRVLGGERSEFSQQLPDYHHGDDIVVSYQFQIGQFQNNAAFFVIGQWHGGDNTGRSPYTAVLLDGNDLSIEYRYGSEQVLRKVRLKKNIKRNRWYKISIRTVVDARDGLLQVRLNNRQVVHYKGPLGYPDQIKAGYWKFGIYRAPDKSTAVVSYKDVVVKCLNGECRDVQ